MAITYLVENEIGLASPTETLSFKDREAIKFVHAYMRIHDDACREEIRSLTGQ